MRIEMTEIQFLQASQKCFLVTLFRKLRTISQILLLTVDDFQNLVQSSYSELQPEDHKENPVCELIVFENSGHALFLEERLKFNDELIKFIKQDNSFVKDFKSTAIKELVD